MTRQWVKISAILSAALAAAAALAQPPPSVVKPELETPPGVQVAGELSLARLVDLCAERLKLPIQYDASTLTGVVTLRMGRPLSDAELWSVTNHALAARGLTTVRLGGPGVEPGILGIVRIADAPGVAAVGAELPPPGSDRLGGAGGDFATILLLARHRLPKDLISAVQPMLSKPSGSVTAIPEARLLMISDTRARIADALRILEQVDVPLEDPVVHTIPVTNMEASRLISTLAAVVAAREGVGGTPMRGKVVPTPDSRALLVIAPAAEVPSWQALIVELDQRQSVETRSYVPRHFGVAEVGRLIEQSARDTTARGSQDQWKMIADTLTGAVTVTATPDEHSRIADLIERLNNASVEARTSVRTYRLKNRPVEQVVSVLSRLIEAGAIDRNPDPGPADNGVTLAPRPGTLETVAQTSPPSTPAGAPPTGTPAAPLGSAAIGAVTAPPPLVAPLPPITRTPGLLAAPVGGGGRGGELSGAGGRRLSMTADSQTNCLIAVGDTRLVEALGPLIESLDHRQAQVMIEVLMVSLSDSDTLNLGVELERMNVFGSTQVSLSSLFGLSQRTANGGRRVADPRGGTALVLDPGDFAVVVRALETINLGRAMTTPRVLVNNNQEAKLDSVLQQPFSTINASNTVATTAFGGTQDAGTQVSVRPQIAEGDHLGLSYTIALSNFVGESTDPALPPPRQRNTLSSEVMIPDGYTIAVGGFEVLSDSKAVVQVPLLGSIPIVGELFKNRTRTHNRQRFYVFITPTVLRESRFEDLKYLSERTAGEATIESGWPEMKPRVIK